MPSGLSGGPSEGGGLSASSLADGPRIRIFTQRGSGPRRTVRQLLGGPSARPQRSSLTATVDRCSWWQTVRRLRWKLLPTPQRPLVVGGLFIPTPQPQMSPLGTLERLNTFEELIWFTSTHHCLEPCISSELEGHLVHWCLCVDLVALVRIQASVKGLLLLEVAAS